ncbi:MAG: YkgJ family cysteine cluster protein [Planctomycetota bacterium]|jgi:Fe-S-cluster containining protein
MANLRTGYPALEAIDAVLPPMPCIACGLCCVSPHITLVEFIRLIDSALTDWPPERLIQWVSTPPELERRYPGNFKCRVQTEKGLCDRHEARPLICRLEGFPVLDRIGMRESHICPYITEEDLEVPVGESDIDRWIADTFTVTNQFYPTYEEPYWLSSLLPECWFAVALDETIKQPFFVWIREMIRSTLDLDFLVPHYENYTRLGDKLGRIDQFFEYAEAKRPRKAVQAIRRVLYDFPFTGTYYQAEGKKYFHLMRDIVQQGKKSS